MDFVPFTLDYNTVVITKKYELYLIRSLLTELRYPPLTGSAGNGEKDLVKLPGVVDARKVRKLFQLILYVDDSGILRVIGKWTNDENFLLEPKVFYHLPAIKYIYGGVRNFYLVDIKHELCESVDDINIGFVQIPGVTIRGDNKRFLTTKRRLS